ncbi:hypothetical protein H1R20_g8770, partial [Candolleomyces eurysporus]
MTSLYSQDRRPRFGMPSRLVLPIGWERPQSGTAFVQPPAIDIESGLYIRHRVATPPERVLASPWQPGCGMCYVSASATDFIGSGKQDAEDGGGLWTMSMRKMLGKWRIIGCGIFCLDSEDGA